jgi:hypothetical protein
MMIMIMMHGQTEGGSVIATAFDGFVSRAILCQDRTQHDDDDAERSQRALFHPRSSKERNGVFSLG